MIRFIDDYLETHNVAAWNRERAREAVLFQYTYWPDTLNKSATTQQFIDVSEEDMKVVDFCIIEVWENREGHMLCWSHYFFRLVLSR